MVAVAAGQGDGAAVGERVAALAGVRVLEASVTRAGRIAGMLLADLGAEVVRAQRGPAAAGGPAGRRPVLLPGRATDRGDPRGLGRRRRQGRAPGR
nr:CoA transferase [Pseudofrankia sp. DC12]